MSHFSFGSRLATQFECGRRLCAGIDPHEFLLAEWNLPNTASGAESFGLRVVECAKGVAASIKPQVAFFERFGAAGYAALETVMTAAREAELLVIADAKRGDVGSSFDAYADAWLEPGSPLEADAVTASAFQGFEVLERALSHVKVSGKGLFVLAATSNPEARPIQQARVESGETVSQHLLTKIDLFNQSQAPSGTLASVGAVLGATLELADFGIVTAESSEHPTIRMPILAPGFGHQGGTLSQAKRSFGKYFEGILVSESRSILNGSSDGFIERIQNRADEVSAWFSKDAA